MRPAYTPMLKACVYHMPFAVAAWYISPPSDLSASLTVGLNKLSIDLDANVSNLFFRTCLKS
jgi:hypothetical protein